MKNKLLTTSFLDINQLLGINWKQELVKELSDKTNKKKIFYED